MIQYTQDSWTLSKDAFTVSFIGYIEMDLLSRDQTHL